MIRSFIRSFIEDSGNRDVMKEIKSRIYELGSHDIEVRKKAASELANIASTAVEDHDAKGEKNRALIVEAGGIPPLVALLSDLNPEVRQNAAAALGNLALDSEGMDLIPTAGGIEAFIALLRDDDRNVRKNVVLALNHLADQYEENCKLIRKAGGIAPLVALLSDADSTVRERAAEALWHLASSFDEHIFLIVQAGGIRPLVILLGDENAGARKNASRALCALAHVDESRKLIGQSGGIQALVTLMRDETWWVRKHAARVLGALAENDQNKLLIERLGWISPLVALLGDANSEIRKKTAHALASLALHKEMAILIVQAGGLPVFLSLLGDENAEVCKEAVSALASFAWNVEHVVPLLTLLFDVNATVRQNAVTALRKVAWRHMNQLPRESQSLIAQAGGAAPLVALLSDEDVLMRVTALEILGLLSRQAENKVLITQAGGVIACVPLLGDNDPEVRREAVRALSGLVWSAEHIAFLVPVLSHPNLVVRQNAAELFMSFACRRQDVGVNALSGAIKPLVALLSGLDTKEEECRAAVFALSDLAVSAENQLLIAQAGGILPLVELLRQPDERIRLRATKILIRLMNVSLWYDQTIAAVFEAQEKKESQAEIKKYLRYILSHWQKSPYQAASNQASLKPELRFLGSAPERCSSVEHSGQNVALTKIGGYAIQGSEVELGRCLGAGNFGEVYEGIYQFQKVAVKKCFGGEPRANDRLKIISDIEAIVGLKHKYLVAFFGVIEEPSRGLSVVTECGEKGSLYHYLGAHRAIDWSWRLRVSEDLARGLAYLHQKHVVHGDVKSLNVVLDEALHPKWSDFGLLSLKQHATRTHAERDQVASVRWMAPELFEGASVASKHTDIWSYGMLLFELATQTVPYCSLSVPQVMARLVKYKSEEVPEACTRHVPKFASLMEACWARQEERPDASTLIEVLAEAREAFCARKRPSESLLNR